MRQRLALEALESRYTPTTWTWSGVVSSNGHDYSNNWSNDSGDPMLTQPGAYDDFVIPANSNQALEWDPGWVGKLTIALNWNGVIATEFGFTIQEEANLNDVAFEMAEEAIMKFEAVDNWWDDVTFSGLNAQSPILASVIIDSGANVYLQNAGNDNVLSFVDINVEGGLYMIGGSTLDMSQYTTMWIGTANGQLEMDRSSITGNLATVYSSGEITILSDVLSSTIAPFVYMNEWSHLLLKQDSRLNMTGSDPNGVYWGSFFNSGGTVTMESTSEVRVTNGARFENGALLQLDRTSNLEAGKLFIFDGDMSFFESTVNLDMDNVGGLSLIGSDSVSLTDSYVFTTYVHLTGISAWHGVDMTITGSTLTVTKVGEQPEQPGWVVVFDFVSITGDFGEYNGTIDHRKVTGGGSAQIQIK